MTYKVKLSSKNQITLPVDALRSMGLNSGDVLTISLDNSQLIIQSISSIKNKAIKHLSELNPYNIKKQNIDLSYKDLAIMRYEKYLKNKAK